MIKKESAISGWLKYNNKKYYFGPDGKAEDGWLKYDGEWYLFHGTECYMFSNRVYITKEGHVYVFDKEGKRCLREWYTVNGKKYYAGSNGRCLRGHWKLGSQYYYFHLTKGYLYKSIMIKKPGNVRLYAQSNGLLYTGGLKTIGGYTYYFKSNSCSHLGWKKMNGKWYYFDTQTAKMLKNTTMKDSKGKEYKFDANGVCIKGKV